MTTDPRRVIEAVWRLEAPRLIAGLTRLVHDLDHAEDLAHDALVAALEKWPTGGIPDNPGAWLNTVARRRAFDALKKGKRAGLNYQRWAADLLRDEPPPQFIDDSPVKDDLLRLIFLTCHPLLSSEAQVALTLRLLGGLTTAEIARALLVPEATVAQRIVRAKRTLAAAQVPFELPETGELTARTDSVLQVIYLIFSEGYAASSGNRWTRKELCDEALRLGRVLAALSPNEPEVLGLAALMEFQASRLGARTTAEGDPILLSDQNRSLWDRVLISRGQDTLERALRLGRPLGPYALQAAIAECHARATRPQDTDWPRIAALYDALVQVVSSPVVMLNRAAAVGMAYGADAGWQAVEELSAHPSLSSYPYLPALRGDLLEKLERWTAAAAEFERAAALTSNLRERSLMLERSEHCRKQAIDHQQRPSGQDAN